MQQRTIYLAKPGSVNKLPKLVHSSNQYTAFTYSKNKKQVAVSRRTRSKIKNKGNNTVFHVTLIMSLVVFALFLLAIKNSSSTKAVASPMPTPIAKPLQETVTPTPIEYAGEQVAVVDEIKQVFGPYSGKALLLLTCENPSLNPHATNQNLNDDGSVASTDYGVFQINNYWQQTYKENFLYDQHINIRMAWRIFQDAGYNFQLWSCGKKLGL